MVLVASWACVYDFGGDTVDDQHQCRSHVGQCIESLLERSDLRLPNAIVVVTAASVLDGDGLTAVCFVKLVRCQDIEKFVAEVYHCK